METIIPFNDDGLDQIGSENEMSDEDDLPRDRNRDDEAEEVPAPGAEAANPVKPKRIVKNPQPKLDATRLMGPRGVGIICSTFRDVKFKGKGYEKDDLDTLMKKLEHWAHRLFPKLTFDDTIKQIEKLGTKKNVQNLMKRIRLDMFQSDEMEIGDENDANNPNVNEVEEVDVFDELLGTGPFANGNKDDLPSQNVSTMNFSSISSQANNIVSTLTPDQLERIERNKMLAAQRRKEKLLAQKEQSAITEVTDDDLVSFSQNNFIFEESHNESRVNNISSLSNSNSDATVVIGNKYVDNTDDEKNGINNKNDEDIMNTENNEDKMNNDIMNTENDEDKMNNENDEDKLNTENDEDLMNTENDEDKRNNEHDKDKLNTENDEDKMNNDKINTENDEDKMNNDKINTENDEDKMNNDKINTENDEDKMNNDKINTENDEDKMNNDKINTENDEDKMKNDNHENKIEESCNVISNKNLENNFITVEKKSCENIQNSDKVMNDNAKLNSENICTEDDILNMINDN